MEARKWVSLIKKRCRESMRLECYECYNVAGLSVDKKKSVFLTLKYFLTSVDGRNSF